MVKGALETCVLAPLAGILTIALQMIEISITKYPEPQSGCVARSDAQTTALLEKSPEAHSRSLLTFALFLLQPWQAMRTWRRRGMPLSFLL